MKQLFNTTTYNTSVWLCYIGVHLKNVDKTPFILSHISPIMQINLLTLFGIKQIMCNRDKYAVPCSEFLQIKRQTVSDAGKNEICLWKILPDIRVSLAEDLLLIRPFPVRRDIAVTSIEAVHGVKP